MAFVAYTFTDAQLVDIRRFCGYMAYGDGAVVFPFPWIMKQYLALEYRLLHISQAEGAVVVNTFLSQLYLLESDIPGTRNNLDTDKAAVWTHNKNEMVDRERLFASWQRRLCGFLGIPPGPDLCGNGNSVSLVV